MSAVPVRAYCKLVSTSLGPEYLVRSWLVNRNETKPTPGARAQRIVAALATQSARVEELERALAPLAKIADAFDANDMDDEADAVLRALEPRK